MCAAPTRPTHDPTSDALRTIGLMVCMYVQLELNMRRFIEMLVHPMGVTAVSGFMARHRFQPPLRTLKVLLRARYAHDPLKLRKFHRWRNRVNKVQLRRNAVIHGSWVDEQGTLQFRRFPRCVGGPVQEMRVELSAQQLARDMRVLRMDIDTIEAWIAAYGGR